MKPKDTFVIQGLAGTRSLKGSVTINGAKNSALKAMAAAILFDGPVTLENVPQNNDIETLTNILKKLGARVDAKKGSLVIDTTSISSTNIDAELAGGMRASVVLTGPMLGRYKKATFPAPGGCVIGARPIDLFLSGYEQMGAVVDEHDCTYDISAAKGMIGTTITFRIISVGATETLMMAAVLAQGTTVLNNCALEPEIANVAEWLNASGASISGIGTSTLTIQGTGGKLLSAKKSFVTIPDRITAGSYLILGALAAQELTIKNCRPDHMESVTKMLAECGVKMDIAQDSITVYGGDSYKPVSELRTREYPGFPTDLQSPMVTFLTHCAGDSRVVETIFEGRFKYVEDLIKLGARITTVNSREIIVHGPMESRQLTTKELLTAHDIRAGFAVVLAALIGKGTSTVLNVHLIDRGYEQLEQVLRGLGAHIDRVSK